LDTKTILRPRWVHRRLPALVLCVALGVSCGGGSPPSTPSPISPAPVTQTIQSVTDGDTVRLTAPLLGASSVRLVNIDSPELGGDSQEPWATASRDALRTLLPAGTVVQVVTGPVALDSFNRVLGVIVRSDGLDVNREQLRQGHAATYFIWPNADRFLDYRTAQIEAQDSGRAIWSASAPLREQPFEYRLRTNNDPPTRPAGDVLTRRFVGGPDYRFVHVNNRLFFGNVLEAAAAGYEACQKDASGYVTVCFAPGR
jgi:endonuclease YncB( thermonuclease family)